MEMKERLMADLKQAMKNREELRTSTLRMLRAEILNKESEKAGVVVDDAVVFSLIRKLIRQRHDSAAQFEKGGRTDLAKKEIDEAAILEQYLPPQLSEKEMRELIKTVIEEISAVSIQDMGKVMGAAMKRLKETGKMFDGKVVNALVREALSAQK
jgi:hypothetical protein